MKTPCHTAHSMLSTLVVASLLMGCSGESLMGPEAAPSEAVTFESPAAKQAQKPAVVDVSGSWNWSRQEHLTLPDWVVTDILQPTNPTLTPEGPITQATCTGSGIMTLVQADATFSGTFTQTAHACVTTGGQDFKDPTAFVPVAVEEGRIRGRSIRMLLDDIMIDCIYHAVISKVQGGVAMALKGGGECIVPGHPKSEIPLDPPPAGTSKTLSFTAVR